jgi:hypothetical protein
MAITYSKAGNGKFRMVKDGVTYYVYTSAETEEGYARFRADDVADEREDLISDRNLEMQLIRDFNNDHEWEKILP